MTESSSPSSKQLKLGTFLDRVRAHVDKWGREAGRVDVDYEDMRALIACADELRKHNPHHRALKWLDSGEVIIHD